MSHLEPAVLASLPATESDLALLLSETDVLLMLLHGPLEEGPAGQTGLVCGEELSQRNDGRACPTLAP